MKGSQLYYQCLILIGKSSNSVLKNKHMYFFLMKKMKKDK